MNIFSLLFSFGKEFLDKKHIGKWSDMSLLKITVLKTVSTKELVRI